MNAIKLSKPLMGYSPEKDQLQKKQSAVFAFLNEKRGDDNRPKHISWKIIFQDYFFSTGYPAFFQAYQPPLRAYTFA
jgi:hypothetical protein